MGRKELNLELQAFKQACQNKGYIVGELYFDEAYPGMIPTPLIVKMMVKQNWIDSVSSEGKALDTLIDMLWETTDAEIRKNVFVLSIYNEHEQDLLEQPQYKEAA